MNRLKILLLPIAAFIEILGVLTALLFAGLKLYRASYFVVNIFEKWPNPIWYMRGWRNSSKDGDL